MLVYGCDASDTVIDATCQKFSARTSGIELDFKVSSSSSGSMI